MTSITMPELILSYSWWTILLVFIIGLAYAGLLYSRNPNNKLSSVLTVILFIFRFLSVSILAFLLLSPTVKTKRKQIERPIIIIGQDNSRSILMAKDSAYYTDTLVDSLNILIKELSYKNDVDTYLFGSDVVEGSSPDYADNKSNYNDFINFIKQNYKGLNVGAVILAGDGIVNNGIDPVYGASNINYPIFTIALGDTSQTSDVKIDDIRHNSIVYSGDIFPVEVSISANKLKGKKTTISLLENKKVIAKADVVISNDSYRKSVKFNVEADKVGKRRYRVLVTPISGEVNSENNVRNIFIDVLDSRQKILILAYAPHPDVGAIKQSLLKNRNYEVETEYIAGFSKDLKKYDLVILHQLPSKRNSAIRVLKSLTDYNIPVLFFLGSQSQLTVFNRYFDGLNIVSSIGNMVPAQFEINNSFTLFSFNDELTHQLATLPPLTVPLGNYSMALGSEVFGWQRINDIVTDFPLVTFYNNIGVKSGVISGEGLWLWRIHDQLQYNNSTAVDVLLNKAVMYLIADTDRRNFRIQSKGEYDSRLDVTMVAELYNQSLELDNSADVRLSLTNEKNEKFDFVFSPFEEYYQLNFNRLPVGVYRYKASVKLGINSYADKGEFVVQQLDNESRNLNADHRLLNRLALEHDGNMYNPKQINDLLTEINNLSSITSKSHYEDSFTGLNTVLAILIGLILLLSVEWFLRKYFGSY